MCRRELDRAQSESSRNTAIIADYKQVILFRNIYFKYNVIDVKVYCLETSFDNRRDHIDNKTIGDGIPSLNRGHISHILSNFSANIFTIAPGLIHCKICEFYSKCGGRKL